MGIVVLEVLIVRMREVREKEALMFWTMLHLLPRGDPFLSGVREEERDLGSGLTGLSGRLTGEPSVLRSRGGTSSARVERRPGF